MIPASIAIDIDEVLSMTTLHWMNIMHEKFDFLEKMRVDNRFYENIPVIEDSILALNDINKTMHLSCYLTTRSEAVRSGTKKWRAKNNFPNARIIMKPDVISSRDGNKWKAEVLQSLYPQTIGVIDDNPGLLDFISDNYKGVVFLYGVDSFKERNIKVIPCKDWKTILIKIKNF